MAHDNDGHAHEHCAECREHLMRDRLKWAVHDEIARLEDLLYEIRAGLVTNVRLRDGVDLESAADDPYNFEWDTLPGGR